MPAKKGFGVLFKVKISSAYVTVANVTKVTPFVQKATVIDSTSHDSASETVEKLAGLKDNGQCSVDLNWNNENVNHFALVASLFGTLVDCEVVFPGSVVAGQTTAQFFAILSQTSPAVPYNDKMTATIALDISGVITWS